MTRLLPWLSLVLALVAGPVQQQDEPGSKDHPMVPRMPGFYINNYEAHDFAAFKFMLSDDVQNIFPADGGFAARSDIAAPAGSPALSSLKILPVDYEYIEKETARIKRRFNEIFQ